MATCRNGWFGSPAPRVGTVGTRLPLSSRARPRLLPMGGGQQPGGLSRVYLGLFGALPRGISGPMGTALLWAVLGPSCNLALKRNCVLCQEHCRSCSLIWSGNFFAWRKSRGSEQASHLGGRAFNAASSGFPLVLCSPAQLAPLPSGAASPRCGHRLPCIKTHHGLCAALGGCGVVSPSPHTAPGICLRSRWSSLHLPFVESCYLFIHYFIFY